MASGKGFHTDFFALPPIGEGKQKVARIKTLFWQKVITSTLFLIWGALIGLVPLQSVRNAYGE